MAPNEPPSSIPASTETAASRRRVKDMVANLMADIKTRTAALTDEERAVTLRNIARVLIGRDMFDELGLSFREMELVEVVGADGGDVSEVDGEDDDGTTTRKRKRVGGARHVAPIDISDDGSQAKHAELEKEVALGLRCAALTIQHGNKTATRNLKPEEACQVTQVGHDTA